MATEKKAPIKKSTINKKFGTEVGTIVRLHRNCNKVSDFSKEKLESWKKNPSKEMKQLLEVIKNLNGKKSLIEVLF